MIISNDVCDVISKVDLKDLFKGSTYTSLGIWKTPTGEEYYRLDIAGKVVLYNTVHFDKVG